MLCGKLAMTGLQRAIRATDSTDEKWHSLAAFARAAGSAESRTHQKPRSEIAEYAAIGYVLFMF